MELIYKEAGNIELIRYESGVDGTRYLANGVISSITTSHSLKSSTLPDGNSMNDLEFDTGVENKVTVNLSSFVPKLHAALIAATASTDGATLRSIKRYAIPSTAPYTITLDDTPSGDPVVHDMDGTAFTKDNSAAAGKYTLATKVLTFAAADAGKSLIIAIDVQETAVTKIAYSETPKSATFRMVICGKAVLREDQAATVKDTMIFDIVKLSGELSPPSREKEPKGWSFTMSVQPPRGGMSPVEYRYKKVTAST